MSFEKPHITYCRIVAFSLIGLAILIVSIYSNSFHCSWHFDDIPNIVENPRLHMENIDWESFKKALFSDRNNPHFPYRPVACLSFALNYYFGKLNVFGYHVVNLGIHLITAIFLFVFIYRTLEYFALTKRWDGDTYFVALLSTVLWAINPIQTQAVTYIVQRMASMAAMFYLIGLYCYLAARTSEEKWKRFTSYVLCGTCFALALGSKENAAMFPISVFLYEALIIQKDPVRFIRRNWISIIAAIGLVILVGLSYFFWKTGKLPTFTAGYENRPFTMAQRLLTEPRVILFYISLLFYPMPNRLNIAHDFNISKSLLNPPTTILAIIAIVVLILLALLIARKKPLISFSILFFFLNHIIESSVFPLELVFEHRNYLPSMFIFLPVAIGLAALLDFYRYKVAMKFVLSGFLVLVLVGMGHSTFMRNFTWKNEKSIWIDAVDKSPSMYRSHHNLGKYYQDVGDYKEAIKEYEIALKRPVSNIKFEKFITYYNLGKLYADKKDYTKAEIYYRKSIALNAKFPDSYNNLGVLMEDRGRSYEAETLLLKAHSLNPTKPIINFNLGLHYLKQNKPDAAIQYLRSSMNDPSLASAALADIGIAFKLKGEYRLAGRYLRQALKEEPTNMTTRLHLAEVLLKKGQKELAISHACKIASKLRGLSNLKSLLEKLHNTSKKAILPSYDISIQLLEEAYRIMAKTDYACVRYLESQKCR